MKGGLLEIMKQKNIPWLGAFIESFYNALPMLTGLNFILLMAASYKAVYDFVSPLFPWFNFGWFVGSVLVFLACVTILMYKYVVPSLNTFRYIQMNKFDSPVLKKIENLENEVRSLKVSRSNNGQDEFDIKTLIKSPRGS